MAVGCDTAAMHSRSWEEGKLQAGVVRRKRRAKGCGSCPGCVRDDCGQCRNCRDKVKFGGPGTKKQRCMLRTCSNMQRKMQRQESVVEEKDLSSVRITCVFCGRKRKKGLSRSALFCTKHCQTSWQDSHPGETPSPAPRVSDCDESLTAQLLEEAYSPEQNITTKARSNGYGTEDYTGEGQLYAWKKSLCAVEDTSLHNLSSLHNPITLSPSPTPLSSPTIYTPPSTAVSQAHIDKWKEIARKLSFHSELRAIWNQLKVSGGFVTNEHFIRHLLHHEASRQCVHYDILCEKDPVSDSEVPQPFQNNSSDEIESCSIPQCENTASKYRDIHECERYLDKVDHNDDGDIILSQQFEKETHALVSPPLQDVLLKADTVDIERNRQVQKEMYEPPENNKEKCVLTVLESQMQCSTDEPDLEVCLDEVINSI